MRSLVRRLLIACCGLLLASGCARFFPPEDPRPPEVLVAQAEELVVRKDYFGASVLYGRALAKQPGNLRSRLRHGELLESLDRDREARDTYRAGLKQAAADAPERPELILRLALLSASRLADIDTAEELLEQLPPGSVPRIDLAAYLYYQTSQYEMSLKLLNQALPLASDPDHKALLLYHAALVYDGLKDDTNSVTSLYHAINNAVHLGLIRDIELLWIKVNAKNQPTAFPPRRD